MLASIPVALPATFTLASALGARALAKLGVLPTRLSAVDEAATMNVLCADKTGTLTQNALTVTTVHPMPGVDETQVLELADEGAVTGVGFLGGSLVGGELALGVAQGLIKLRLRRRQTRTREGLGESIGNVGRRTRVGADRRHLHNGRVGHCHGRDSRREITRVGNTQNRRRVGGVGGRRDEVGGRCQLGGDVRVDG